MDKKFSTVKLANYVFGSSFDHKELSQPRAMRWKAPELLLQEQPTPLTPSQDVYSYAILLWVRNKHFVTHTYTNV